MPTKIVEKDPLRLPMPPPPLHPPDPPLASRADAASSVRFGLEPEEGEEVLLRPENHLSDGRRFVGVGVGLEAARAGGSGMGSDELFLNFCESDPGERTGDDNGGTWAAPPPFLPLVPESVPLPLGSRVTLRPLGPPVDDICVHEWRRPAPALLLAPKPPGIAGDAVWEGRRLSLAESSDSTILRVATISDAAGLLVWSACQAAARSLQRRSGQLLRNSGRSPPMTTFCSLLFSGRFVCIQESRRGVGGAGESNLLFAFKIRCCCAVEGNFQHAHKLAMV